ncbi:MAG: Hsp20/alpha crystallin family protein [Deltaproteobacteria bacterium]|nr:Hsp20/alpha crystallin family protein [Deltaproteobacteria bacterium]
MAKSTKKKSASVAMADETSLVQLIMEGMSNVAGSDASKEPVNHVPYVDLYSNKDEVTVDFELPGMKAKDINIAILKGTLTVTAVKYDCLDEGDDVNYICMERAFGRVFRAIDIPFPVNTNKIKAIYKDGTLTVRLPRVEEKRGEPKPIKIETE